MNEHTNLPDPLRPIWEKDFTTVQVIDQRVLPHEVIILDISTGREATDAIRNMVVRGAPLIGITAAYGVYLVLREARQKSKDSSWISEQVETLAAARPTAVNLQWAIDRMLEVIAKHQTIEDQIQAALEEAREMTEEDAAVCKAIGTHGLDLIKEVYERHPDRPVQILTHCNAGMLACIEWGTATSPIYQAHQLGIPVHVWVDETRPRNQGANLTCWELGWHGVPHTLIVDNAGGHLMQHGKVDLVFTGTDRTTSHGDVANKIGTYLKALAAHDNKIPFYVALPSSTIDWSIQDGLLEIPIEERHQDEVLQVVGNVDGTTKRAKIGPAETTASNYGFDVTPARLISGLITERGICPASNDGLLKLFPEHG